mmetsp:Transcript_17452/g.34826  ORF Transcript_17452/g.34826 Transcript_17452/m.34826 type:complete len:183 (+) Transcript_17452:313-861(+)
MPATYTHGSGTATLHFEFRVIEGDNLDRLDVSTQADASLMLPLPHDDTITLLTNGDSSSPVTADLAYGAISLPDILEIAIDTTPPTVISISPQALTAPDGTSAVGDVLTFQVIFDKPVDVSTCQCTIYFAFTLLSPNDADSFSSQLIGRQRLGANSEQWRGSAVRLRIRHRGFTFEIRCQRR